MIDQNEQQALKIVKKSEIEKAVSEYKNEVRKISQMAHERGLRVTKDAIRVAERVRIAQMERAFQEIESIERATVNGMIQEIDQSHNAREKKIREIYDDGVASWKRWYEAKMQPLALERKTKIEALKSELVDELVDCRGLVESVKKGLKEERLKLLQEAEGEKKVGV